MTIRSAFQDSFGPHLYFTPQRSASGRLAWRACSERGFTKIELLIALLLVSIVTAFALPSLDSVIQKQNMRLAQEEMRAALSLGRMEAIRRSRTIKIRKLNSAGALNCADSSNNWSCGWVVFLDGNNNSVVDSGDGSPDTLIQISQLEGNVSVKYSNNAAILGINRFGNIHGVAASFVIAPKDANGTANSNSPLTRTICVSSGGRIRYQDGSRCS